MQNGGSETDGVRYISPDGTYTDTVLYDSPNTNHLTEDTGNPGNTFAPDVSAGFSLARVADGLDTNNCEDDFIAEANPTPGYPNNFPVDYALTETHVTLQSDFVTLHTDIRNYSPANCDTISVSLKVSLNDILIQSFTVPPVSIHNYYYFQEDIGISEPFFGTLKVELVVYNDINPSDNIWTMQFGTPAQLSACINEILYSPDSGNQEWIELRVVAYAQGNFTITDAAGNSCQIALPLLCPEYLVLCRDQSMLAERYPACPPGNILQVSSLPALNNDGDYLVLKSSAGAVIDSISYIGNSNKRDISLERYVRSDSTVSWHYCYDTAKGTPGQINSEPPPPPSLAAGTVKIVGSPFNPLDDDEIKLQYNFTGESNKIFCSVYDLQGRKRYELASGISVGNHGEIKWNGKDKSGKALPRGKYILLVEAKNSDENYFLKKQLSVVLATK